MAIPRIPYTNPFSPPSPIPRTATTLPAAVSATAYFLARHPRTLLLSGAGLSVASGLADYRGESGTYRLNRRYRPIFYHEFRSRHPARQRYWARSMLGWPSVSHARPNAAHKAVEQLRNLGLIGKVVTQNVDSLHTPPTIELHGTLATLTCLSCGSASSRTAFQDTLRRLNPQWASFLAFGRSELRTNPDGDIDLPDAPYRLFRYPPCEKCGPGTPLDADGAMLAQEGQHGVLKPSVVFFGETVREEVKQQAEQAVRSSSAVLVVGSSLATYSAWRLVKLAQELGLGIGAVNLGGLRGEKEFFGDAGGEGERLRVEFPAEDVLSGVVAEIEK